MLRRKIFLGVIPPLILFFVVGIAAVIQFHKLGNAIAVILKENYQSVVASQKMREAAMQIDASFLRALEGDEKEGAAEFQAQSKNFADALAIEFNNITLPGEQELAEKTRRFFDDYHRNGEQFFKWIPGSADRSNLYRQQLRKESEDVENAAEEILAINQNNMLEAKERARQLSATSSRIMIGTILIAAVIAIAGAIFLRKSLLRPIKALTESSRELGEGNLDQIVPVLSQDELGELANAFNKMASKLRLYRQTTNDKILKAQAITSSTLAAFPDPIFVFSSAHQIELQNAAANSLIKAIGGTDRLPTFFFEQVQKVLNGGENIQPTSFDQAVAISLVNEETFFLPRILALRNETGEREGAVLVLQNVTRFRLADEVKTHLISTVSHELKTPLTSLQMAVYVLLEEKVGLLNSKQIELLLTAASNSDRLVKMIEDLLDLAQFEEGVASLERQSVSPKDLVETAVKTACAGEMIPPGEWGLEIKVADELPQVFVNCDRIGQVFNNLISNAVKYSPPQSKIVIAVQPGASGTVRFSVQDEGLGIPEAYQLRIFEKFFRVPDSKGEGVGLGLAIAKQIVEAHGGSIGFKAKKGSGTEFFFFLPQAAPVLAASFPSEKTAISNR